MTVLLSVVICVVGLIVYLVAEGKVSNAGWWAYVIGLAAFLLQADRVVALIK